MPKKNSPRLTLNQKVEIARINLPRAFVSIVGDSNKANTLAELVPDGVLREEIHRKGANPKDLSATTVHRLIEVARLKAERIVEATRPTPLRLVGRSPPRVSSRPRRTAQQGKIQLFRRRVGGR